MLIIRRKKMRKFKRKKRLKRDYFILQKRHLKKKLKVLNFNICYVFNNLFKFSKIFFRLNPCFVVE